METTTTMAYAQVAVASAPTLFDYAIPPHLAIEPGCCVQVPLRNTSVVGVVVTLHSTTPPYRVKEIAQRLCDMDDLGALVCWLIQYYGAPPATAMKLITPPKHTQRRAPPVVSMVVRKATKKKIADYIARYRSRKPAQCRALDLLLVQKGEMLLQPLLERSKTTKKTWCTLQEEGWLTLRARNRTTALDDAEQFVHAPPPLRDEQALALQTLEKGIGSAQVFLLQGKTGSGKTEVYLRFIEQLVPTHTVLLLVPEIALIPQTVQRLKGRINHPIAVWHSGIAQHTRAPLWQAIAHGKYPIVVGARSALFLPMPRLGAILLDEEHDSGYKADQTPFYHARDCAIIRGRRAQCPVVLGSATPSLESYSNALLGKYHHLHLTTTQSTHAQHRFYNTTHYAGTGWLVPPLLTAIEQRAQRGEQSLLLLNRRGYWPQVRCRQCGTIALCDQCDRGLTFHKERNKYQCHLCHKQKPAPLLCRSCGSQDFQPLGIGGERLSAFVRQKLPTVRVMRIDTDTVSSAKNLEKMLGEFRAGKADVLIGTQMIAKGHCFPSLTLAAVVDADGLVAMPDMRAGERAFQLIAQTLGRAGRYDTPGLWVVQSYQPCPPLFQYAMAQDYTSFAQEELATRKALHLPPYTHQILCTVHAATPAQAQHHAIEWHKKLPQTPELFPPEMAYRYRVEKRYRHLFTVRCPDPRRWIPLLKKTMPAIKEGRCTIEVDPLD